MAACRTALEATTAAAGDAAAIARAAAPAAALAHVAGDVATLERRVTGVEAGVAAAHTAVSDAATASGIRADAAAAAAAAALATAVAELRRELAAARSDTATRAYVSSLEATDEAVGGAQASLDALTAKVDICLRFVEWFAEKGEAYEYNASALERHMNALAVGNRAPTRDRARGVGTDLSSLTSHLPPPPSTAGGSGGGTGGAGGSVAPSRIAGSTGVRIGGVAAPPS